MKVVKLEAIPVRIPYKRVEASSLIARSGVADVLVKVTTEDGLVGWGECTRAADTAGHRERGQRHGAAGRRPQRLGQGADPPRSRHLRRLGVPADDRQLRLAGIDMALWDVCGKACGQPLYRLFGGAMREEVDYFYYMEWGTPEEIARQGQATAASAAIAPTTSRPASTRSARRRCWRPCATASAPKACIRIDVNQAWDHADGGAPAQALAREVHHRFRRSAGAHRSHREQARPA